MLLDKKYDTRCQPVVIPRSHGPTSNQKGPISDYGGPLPRRTPLITGPRCISMGEPITNSQYNYRRKSDLQLTGL